MPYKDWPRQRVYQRNWKRARKAKFLAGAACARCGSTEDLQLHHRDPAEKDDHRIWSWSEARILSELGKCDVLCRPCHSRHHWQLRRLPKEAEDAIAGEILNNLQYLKF